VVAGGPGDPDLAPFARGARLGEALVVAPRGRPPRLGYWTPMEREEAAATGVELLHPEELGLADLARRHPDPSDYLAAALAAALDRAGVARGTIALAGSTAAGTIVEACARLAASGWTFVSGAEASRRMRKRKSDEELAEIRLVSNATVEIFRLVAARLAAATVRDGELWSAGERLTVGSLKREIALEVAARGLTEPRENIVAPGEEGGVPHTAGTPGRVLRAGESLIVDLFPKGRLFADCSRTFCVGAAPEELVRAHADVRAALELAHRRAVAGARAFELQRAVCELLAARDWPTPLTAAGTLRGYVHNLGHGVGYELHELPSFRDAASEADGRLEPGDVVTLEPGLYEPAPGGFGVRLEDLVVIGEDGTENRTPLPYDLDPGAWRG
jgi:Xaa-Pro aminopeptidase